MTTFTLFLAIFLAIFTKAQQNPTLYNTLGTTWANNTYLDKATNDLYICYTQDGFITKVNLNAANLAQTTVISGLTLPVDMTVVNNRLYFIEGASGVDSTPMQNPIPNTGKLYSLDLSVSGATKQLLMSGLNTPLKLEGSSTYMIIDENTFDSTTGEILTEQVSKLNLSGTPSKTLLMSRTNTAGVTNQKSFEKLVLVGDKLYANSFYYTDIQSHFYEYNLLNNNYNVTHTMLSNHPFAFAVNQNKIYYSTGSGSPKSFSLLFNSSTPVQITAPFTYNSEQIYFEDWHFDNNNNAYIYTSGFDFNTNIETMKLFKYNATQLLSTIELTKSNRVVVSPNPTKSTLNFSEELSEIKIVDISGKQVLANQSKIKTINVENLVKGNYLITDKDKNSKTITEKFIKE